MSDVFISYSRKDIEAAKKLKVLLELDNMTVWMDVSDLEGGSEAWQKQIRTAIDETGAIAFLLSQNSLQSEFVREEIDYGRQNGKPIFPLMIMDCEIPFEFQNVQVYFARTDKEYVETIVKLLRDLRKRIFARLYQRDDIDIDLGRIAYSATKLAMVTGWLSGTLDRHFRFLEEKIRQGCQISIILMKPDSISCVVKVYAQLSYLSMTPEEIASGNQRALDTRCKYLMSIQNGNQGRCQVRLLDQFVPYGMVLAESSNESVIWLQPHSYKTDFTDRPNLLLRPETHSIWFEFYKRQYRQIYKDAEPWNPE